MSLIINNKNNIQESGKILHKILQNKNEKTILSQLMSKIFSSKEKKDYNLLRNKFKTSNLQGKSGAVILFHIDNDVNLIMKNTKTIFKKKQLLNINNNNCVYYDKNCIKIRNDLNEIIVNLVMNNLNLFINKYDSNKYNKYIIKILDFGIFNHIKSKQVSQKSYIIQEKVGTTFVDTETYNKYTLTNLHDVCVKNYIPLLVKLSKNVSNNSVILKTFIKYITYMFQSYNELLQMLNTEIGFCHGDMKMTNVFIKKYLFTREENPSFKENEIDLLKTNGFIIDILPTISDLDKSSLFINNNKVRSYHTWENVIINVNYFKGNNLIYKFRHECAQHLKICNSKYTPSHFDTLNIIINLLLLMNTNINNINILRTLHNNTLNNNKILTLFYVFIKKTYSINKDGIDNLITYILKMNKTTLDNLKKHFGVAILSQSSQLFLCNNFKKNKITIKKNKTSIRKSSMRKRTYRKSTKDKKTKRK